jgi:hypothetical protein
MPPAEAAYEEREFTRRFRGLVYALREFSETYNAGHVINVKRVKAIQKGWRNRTGSRPRNRMDGVVRWGIRNENRADL